MILHFHRQPADRWIIARTLRYGPTLHDAIQFESEIEMQVARCVFLHDEVQRRGALLRRTASRGRLSARGLLCPREIALTPIFGELGRGTSLLLRCHRALPRSLRDAPRASVFHAVRRRRVRVPRSLDGRAASAARRERALLPRRCAPDCSRLAWSFDMRSRTFVLSGSSGSAVSIFCPFIFA